MYKQFTDLVKAMLTYLAAAGADLTDFNPGSVLRTLLEAVCAAIEECYLYLAVQARMFFVATSEGAWLDKRVQDFGMTRKTGDVATGTIYVGRDSPAPFAILIPAGTLFELSGKAQYKTLADATLPEGATQVEVAVTATAIGAAANLAANTVLSQVGTAVAGVQWGKVKALSGGDDAETDDALKARFLDRMRNPGTSGNQSDYRQWAMAIDGVTAAQVLPLWNGPGTVKVVLLGADKQPPTADVVAAVQNAIAPTSGGERKAPIGATVTVVAAEAVPINIAATILLDQTNPAALSAIQTAFQTAVKDYLGKLAFQTDTVRYARVGSLLVDQTGVLDYVVFTVNGGTSNIAVSSTQVAVLGEVTLSVQ